MADSSTAAAFDYDLLIGPLVIGLIVDTIVFGLCFMLAARYMLLNFKDGWQIKTLLVWTFVLNAFQIGSETSMIWHYVVANFMNPSILSTFPWQYSAVPLFSSLVALPIQLFLARRVVQLADSTVSAAIMAVLAVAQAVLNVITSARRLSDTTLAEPQTTTRIAMIVSVIATVVISLILSACILRRQRKLQSDSDPWGIGYYAWVFAASSAPSAVLTLLELVVFFAKPTTNLHIAFALPIARLYTTALLANLNERKQTRTQSETSQNKPISLGVLSQNRAAKPNTPVHITISQDVDVQMESIESDKVSDKHAPFAYSPSTPQSGYSYGKSEPMGLGYN